MQLSEYQKAIEKAFLGGLDNTEPVYIQAVPGSAKSTTRRLIMGQMPESLHGKVVSVSFSRATADQDKGKLPATLTSKTFHGLGYAALREKYSSIKSVTERKYQWWLDDAVIERRVPFKVQKDWRTAVGNLINTVRHQYVDYREPANLEPFLDITTPFDADEASDLMTDALAWGKKKNDRGYIDFTDMLYWPVYMNLPLESPRYFFLDEGQDTTPLQLRVLCRLVGEQTKCFVVGDENQAIYGFLGADEHAMQNIRTKLGVEDKHTFQLPICYRCPTSHVERINAIYPGVESPPGQARGTFENLRVYQLEEQLKFDPDALVICRVNAALADMAHRLMRQGIPVCMRGRGFSKDMMTLARRVLMVEEDIDWKSFLCGLQIYVEKKRESLLKKNAEEMELEALDDRCLSLTSYYAAATEAGVASLNQFQKFLEGIEDQTDSEQKVKLSSIHGVKGDEHRRVYILRPELLGSNPKARTEKDRKQEKNLHYVAESRSQGYMAYVKADALYAQTEFVL